MTQEALTLRHRPLSFRARRPLWLRLLDRLVVWDRRWRDRTRLDAMTDQQLRDLGLTRRDLRRGP